MCVGMQSAMTLFLDVSLEFLLFFLGLALGFFRSFSQSTTDTLDAASREVASEVALNVQGCFPSPGVKFRCRLVTAS